MRVQMTRYAIAMLLAATTMTVPALAQGVKTEGAVDTIVGSTVREQESTATADHARIVAAIDKAGETAAAVRKIDKVESVEIVFLPDAAAAEGGPPADIEARLKARKSDIDALRQEIEGNALLYYAIESKQIVMRDVLAIEIGDGQRVTVYAAGKPAG